MAGSNQATNLSGMLTQMGQTLGRDRDISSITRGIENMSRPDSTGEGGMLALADWQTRMGRAQEAAVTANLIQQEEVKRQAMADASSEQTDKMWTANYGRLVGERAKAVQDQNFGLVNEIDRKLAAAGPQTEKQLLAANRFGESIKAQDTAIAGARSVADVEAYDKLSRQQEEYRAKAAAAAPGSPEAQRYQQIVDGMERSKEKILLSNPDAVKAMKDIDDLKASQAGNMEKAKELDASQQLWAEAAKGKEALQAFLDDNPELAKYAGNVLESMNKLEEERAKVLASPPSVEKNNELATELKKDFATIPGLTKTEQTQFDKRVDALTKSGLLLPKDAQEELLKLKATVYTRAGQVADIQRAAEAGERAKMSSAANSIAMRTVTKAERTAAKDLIPGKLAALYDYQTLPDFQQTEIDEVAKDQKRMGVPGLETFYQYDASGKVALDKDGKLARNPNFGNNATSKGVEQYFD